LFTAIAIAYALLAKEKWNYRSRLTAPQVSGFSLFKKWFNDFSATI